MRISDLAVLTIATLLAGCGDSEQAAAPIAQDAPKIACALDGSARFSNVCTLTEQGETLLVSAPDGGFRRLRIVPGGVEAADGAEPALITPLKDMVEVRIGNDAYRLPARIQ